MWRAAVGVILVLAAVTGFAQEPAPQAATRPATSNQERLASLLALIEGQNAPDVRRTGARELLLQRWSETPPRLITLLSGPNAAAKVAVATVLAEQPEFLDPAYIDPLINMLADADPAVRQAAAGALAGYRDNGVTPRLQQLALDSTQTRPARLAAISALGLMTEREAIGGLVAVLSDPDPTLAQAALSALAQATAMDFGEDAAAARAWWEGSRTLSREVWQQLQIERLVRKDREMRRRLDTMEARLAKALEASFLRAADTERVTLLVGYLADASTTIRLLGLRFAQLHLAEGKSLPTE
ncbi:MAG TPA: HEAT repeat domain-containing protein, partial [Phycisphaerae bacterium]|nr:HEAT repeat domain-containing protein [Phycisphaerae bacterium]